MSQPFLGEIKMFGGNFAPLGYALCDGQLMSIQQNTALFSILGTTYGGDGIQTFGLPDMRCRMPVHQGNGPGLTPFVLGEITGSQSVSILTSNLPSHTHLVGATSGGGTATGPAGGFLAASTARDKVYSAGPPDTTLSPQTVGLTGNNIPISIIPPVLCVNFIIALQGIFPSRN